MYEDARPLIGAFDADAWPRPEWKPSRVTELERVVSVVGPRMREEMIGPRGYSQMVVNAGSGIVARSRALDTEAFHIRQRLPVVEGLVPAYRPAEWTALLGPKPLDETT